MSRPPFTGKEPGVEPPFRGPEPGTAAAGRWAWASMILAGDPSAMEALAAGEAVPRHRLNPDALAMLNDLAAGDTVTLTDEVALRLDVHYPASGNGGPREPAPDEEPAEPFRIDVYTARALCGLQVSPEEPELVGPFLRRGRITLLGATTGHGKTTFGAQMLAAGVLGGDFLGWTAAGGLRVLVLDLEQHLEDIREQLDAVGLADCELVDYAPIPEGLQIDRDREQLAELERVVAAKPYDVVRVDPFYKLHAADSSEELQARALVRLTRRWVNRHGFALLMDTHTRKRIEGRAGFTLDDLFGSSLFARDPEVILGLQLVEDGFSRLHVFKARGRRGDIGTGQTIDLLYSDDELFCRRPDEDERDMRAELIELAGDYAWRTLKEWKAKPGRADADPTTPNYVELRGGIGAGEAKVKATLGELQVEEVFEYAEGPPGRSAQARCWRLRPTAPDAQGTLGQSGQSGSSGTRLVPLPR
ncbi:MAG: AAA family ATPase [Gaiellaceae bacterium]